MQSTQLHSEWPAKACHQRPRCQHHRATRASAAAKNLARDVRQIPIKLVTVAKGNSAGSAAAAGEWLDKARRYTRVDEIVIKPNPKRSAVVAVQVQTEGEKVRTFCMHWLASMMRRLLLLVCDCAIALPHPHRC